MGKFIAGWIIGLGLAISLGSLFFVIGNAFAGGEWYYWEFMRNWLIGYLLLELFAMFVKAAMKISK